VFYYLNSEEQDHVTVIISRIYTKTNAIEFLDDFQIAAALEGMKDFSDTPLIHSLLLKCSNEM
jgi:hypothetical protein